MDEEKIKYGCTHAHVRVQFQGSGEVVVFSAAWDVVGVVVTRVCELVLDLDLDLGVG